MSIHLVEVYGMSESTAVSTMCLAHHNQLCAAGPPLLGVEVVAQGHEREGEICVRGRKT